MAVTKRDLEIALHNAVFRAEEAEQKTADREHTLNLLLNGAFDKFHTALSENGAVHEFSLGVVYNVPVQGRISRLAKPNHTENRRIILWRTEFEAGRVFACGYSEQEFRQIPSHLSDDEAAEIRSIIQETIKKIPSDGPLMPD